MVSTNAQDTPVFGRAEDLCALQMSKRVSNWEIGRCSLPEIKGTGRVVHSLSGLLPSRQNVPPRSGESSFCTGSPCSRDLSPKPPAFSCTLLVLSSVFLQILPKFWNKVLYRNSHIVATNSHLFLAVHVKELYLNTLGSDNFFDCSKSSVFPLLLCIMQGLEVCETLSFPESSG